MTFRRGFGLILSSFIIFLSFIGTAETLSVVVRQTDLGPEVVRIQEWLNILGYMPEEPTGYFGEVTHHAVTRFQKDHGLTADGIVGRATYEEICREISAILVRSHKVGKGESLEVIASKYNVTPMALREYNRLDRETPLHAGQVLRVPPATIASRGRGNVEPIPWEKVHNLFRIGSLAKVTDVETGLSFFIYRRGGHKHADCEPYSREDTAIMLAIYNGKWSWARRAVIVEFGSRRIAASLNGMPHGNCDIKENNFDGHFCLHFYGSRTHQSDRVDSEHQSKLMQAAGMFRSN